MAVGLLLIVKRELKLVIEQRWDVRQQPFILSLSGVAHRIMVKIPVTEPETRPLALGLGDE